MHVLKDLRKVLRQKKGAQGAGQAEPSREPGVAPRRTGQARAAT